MAVAYRSVGTVAGADDSTCVIPKPTGLAVGDLMIAVVTGAGNSATCTLSGWTAIDSLRELVIQGGKTYTLWKIASAGDVAAPNFTFTMSTSVADLQGAIFAFSGADQTTPINQHVMAVQTVGSVQTSPIWPVGFTPSADCMLLLAITGSDAVGGAISMSTYAIATSSPTWTEVVDQVDTTDGGWSLAAAYGLRSAATATGNASASSSPSSYSIATMIAIAPSTASLSKNLALLGVG